MDKLNYRETWDGEHRGVSFQVSRWRLGWAYYLTIPVKQLPDDKQMFFNLDIKTSEFNGRERFYYEYSSAVIVSDLEWHGGITFYEKIRDDSGVTVAYKLGCDFAHLWDEGVSYEQTRIVFEAHQSIDELIRRVPNLKLRCAWNGQYYSEDETYLTDKDVRVALENKEAWEKPIRV